MKEERKERTTMDCSCLWVFDGAKAIYGSKMVAYFEAMGRQ